MAQRTIYREMTKKDIKLKVDVREAKKVADNILELIRGIKASDRKLRYLKARKCI